MLLIPFLAWGCWQQRKNPGLGPALVGSAAITAVVIGLGAGGILLAILAGLGVVVIGGLGWMLDKVCSSSPETDKQPAQGTETCRHDPLSSAGYVTPQFRPLPPSVGQRANSITTWRAVPKRW